MKRLFYKFQSSLSKKILLGPILKFALDLDPLHNKDDFY
jgi:hypothetical protein